MVELACSAGLFCLLLWWLARSRDHHATILIACGLLVLVPTMAIKVAEIIGGVLGWP